MDNYISIFHKEVTLKYLIFPPVLAGVVENVWTVPEPAEAFKLFFSRLLLIFRCWKTPLNKDILYNFLSTAGWTFWPSKKKEIKSDSTW